jgi:hypothetical protein
VDVDLAGQRQHDRLAARRRVDGQRHLVPFGIAAG